MTRGPRVTAGRSTKGLLGCLAWGLALGFAGGASRASADSLGECIDGALGGVLENGARPLQRPRDSFLIAPDSAQHAFTLPDAGCLGLLAVGRRHAQALSLAVYRNDGRIAARQGRPGVYAYVRACGNAGERFIAHVRMREGSGEVRLVPIWQAPESLPRLEEAMEGCRDVGMPRPEPVDVGPEPISPPLYYSLHQLSGRLAKLGYRRKGQPLRGSLGAMRRDVRRLMLPGPRCYAIVALGDGDVGDIDLRIFGPEEAPRLVVGDYAHSREAVVKMCVDGESRFLMDVRMYDGGGSYVVQGYELPPPRMEVPAGTTGRALVGLTEVETLFAARGLTVQNTIWMLLPPRGEQRVPLHLAGRGCYGIALVPSSDQEGQGDLDLGVTDEAGNLVSADMGPGKQPLVYVCPQVDGLYMAIGRTPDVVRHGRALLVVASDVAEGREPGPVPPGPGADSGGREIREVPPSAPADRGERP